MASSSTLLMLVVLPSLDMEAEEEEEVREVFVDVLVSLADQRVVKGSSSSESGRRGRLLVSVGN